MRLRRPESSTVCSAVCSAGVLLASASLGGCGGTMYNPRPSPRIQVVPDGSQIALVKNGHRYGTGVLGGAVEEAVEGNPEAEEEARSYRQRGIAGFVLSTVGSVTAGVGAGLLVGNELQQNPSSTLNIASIAMTIGGAVVSIVGSFLVGGASLTSGTPSTSTTTASRRTPAGRRGPRLPGLPRRAHARPPTARAQVPAQPRVPYRCRLRRHLTHPGARAPLHLLAPAPLAPASRCAAGPASRTPASARRASTARTTTRASLIFRRGARGPLEPAPTSGTPARPHAICSAPA